MDTLVAMGTWAAFGYSVAITALPGRDRGRRLPLDTFYETAAIIIGFVLIGRWLEARAKHEAAGPFGRSSVGSRRRPGRPGRGGGGTRAGRDSRRRPGPRPTRRADRGRRGRGRGRQRGGRVHAHRRVGAGGEGPGDRVTGATLNATRTLVVRTDRVGTDTTLAQIARLVEHAQGSKAPIQRTVDRVVAWFVPAVALVAALTFVAWMLFGPDPQLPVALASAIGVLIIACPCAMGLATPTA